MGLAILILGLAVFLSSHLFVTRRETRAAAIARLGKPVYYGLFGLISLIALALALLALYGYKLAGAWRGTYVVCAAIALYLNCFVLVVQSFQKISFVHALAPTQKEPPFAVAQGVLLIVFIGLGVAAFKKFRPIARAPAAA